MLLHILASALIRNVLIADAYECIGSNLDCKNGYECAEGGKDYMSMDIFSDTMLNELPFFEIDNVMQEHCDCGENSIIPGGGKGMTGVGCTEMFQICPDKTVCFHGAPCQKGADDNYICDCAKTIYPTDEIYVGKHCEYKVTDLCDYPEGEEYDLSKIGKWMCANEGNCRDSAVSPVDMCECPVGFSGHHCEFKGNAPECDLGCFNGGICENGVKNYDSLDPALQAHFEQDDGYDTHCICPKGFTGRRCESRASICSMQCESGSSSCFSNGQCLNGGKCGEPIISGDSEYFYCNCTEASSENDLEMKFAGHYCESSSSTHCPVPSGFDRKDFFCTNNGQCPENYWNPCSCPVNYSGPRCEFLVEYHIDCNLKCMNGGTCFHGDAPSTTLYDDLNLELQKLPDHVFNIYCICPDGFTGPQCETKIDICGDSEHHCLNNGKCVRDDDEYTCKCITTANAIFSGKYCEDVENCGYGLYGESCAITRKKKKTALLIEEEFTVAYLVIVSIFAAVFLLLLIVQVVNRRKQSATHSLVDTMPEEEIMHDVSIT